MAQSRKDKIDAARKIMPANKWFPSLHAHIRRNDFNCVPNPDNDCRLIENAVEYRPEQGSCCGCCCKNQHFQVFRDTFTASNWVLQPWWLSIFHKPWKNCKLIAYDSDIVTGATGSSEVIIPKSALQMTTARTPLIADNWFRDRTTTTQRASGTTWRT